MLAPGLATLLIAPEETPVSVTVDPLFDPAIVEEPHEYYAQLRTGLESLVGHGVTEVRCLGLWAGLDIDPALGTGKQLSVRLAQRGVLFPDIAISTQRVRRRGKSSTTSSGDLREGLMFPSSVWPRPCPGPTGCRISSV